MYKENEITRSWKLNAQEWSRIIEEEGIASRKFTNPAIVEAVTAFSPLKILDLGCGEGWLTRKLSREENTVSGADATGDLLEAACRKGKQKFYLISYEEIIAGLEIPGAPYNAIVLNFCLYQKNEVPQLLDELKSSLSDDGHIFIQTLHPSFLLSNNLTYEDQWIADSWKGLNGNFIQPHPWYARTFQSWIIMFRDCHYELTEVKEILNENKSPVSVIFILKKKN